MEAHMNRFQFTIHAALAASLTSLMLSASAAFAEPVSREQIIEALTVQLRPQGVAAQGSTAQGLADKLQHARGLTLTDHDYVVASDQSKPAIDLYQIYFEFDSATLTADALPQLRELGAALNDPRLRGSAISIAGHTDAAGNANYNLRLSERRATAVRRFLIENYKLSPATLHAFGYGKQRPKNTADVFAAENRRVEIVNETLRPQAQR
jgi:outer membrane protein OmpA-like peptidoglycan-associated protein